MNKSEAELNALAYLEGLGYTCIPSDAKFTPANVKTLAKYLLVWAEQAEKASSLGKADYDCTTCKWGKFNDHYGMPFCYNPNECENWKLYEKDETK